MAKHKLSPWAFKLINDPLSFKFLGYIDPSDGYPIVIPCMQLCAPDRSKLIFNLSQYKKELKSIAIGTQVAIILNNFEAVSHHINGTLTGFKKYRGYSFGIIEIDEIYNCMPPVPGIIYPKIQTLPKVTDFHL
ncbi:MAG: hypothetical protein GY870_01345 [archaeon]|nr:hypothetical protein [archaeon]